mgnify:FL=1
MLIKPKSQDRRITAELVALEAAFELGEGLRKGHSRGGYVRCTRARREQMPLQKYVVAEAVVRGVCRGVLFRVVIEDRPMSSAKNAFAVVTRLL